MKRLTALFLALVMIVGLAACSGDKTGDTAAAEGATKLSASGVTVKTPDSLSNLKGTINFYDGGEIEYGANVVYCEIDYFTMPQDEYNELVAKDQTTVEDQERYNDAYNCLAFVFGIKDGGADELTEYLLQFNIASDTVEEIGKAGDWTFFCVPQVTEDDAEDMDEYAEEFKAVLADLNTITANMTFSEPVSKYKAVEEGTKIDFDTTDLDGNPVSMADILAQHDVTMINIWATWCGPCVGEMPDLADLNTEFAEKNCAIVGILSDDTDEETLADAKEILYNAGADFTVVVAPENLAEIIPLQAYPTSYFVDSKGNVIGEPIIGAATDVYAEKMDEALASVRGK